jgi:hypothetical protein
VTNVWPIAERVVSTAAVDDCCDQSEDDASQRGCCPLGCGLELCLCSSCPLQGAIPPMRVASIAPAIRGATPLFPPLRAPDLLGPTRRVFHPPKA